MLTIAIIIFAASVIFLGLASIIFRIRAFANKPAWNGPVIPLGVIGFILLVVSLVLIYLNYPQ